MDEVSPQKDLDEAREFLDSLGIGLIPERNEPCYCGSGKKYKKICEEKDRKSDSFSTELEMTITDNILTLLYADGEMLSEKDEAQFLECLDKLDEEQVDAAVLKTLQKLAKKYHNPFIWENLAVAYERLGLSAECDGIDLQKKFPDYLFSKIAQAYNAINKGHPELVPEIFDKYQYLPLLYIDRDEFHGIEVYMFHELWLMYSYEINDLRQAEMHFAILQAIGSHQPDFAEAEEVMDELRLQRRMKIALNRT